MPRIALAALALGLSFAGAPVAAPPAAAQSMFTGCIAHDYGGNIRTRFVYVDWQGTEHRSGWVTGGLGHRNCARWQDLRRVRAEAEVPGGLFEGFRWQRLCEVGMPTQGRPVVRIRGNSQLSTCHLAD